MASSTPKLVDNHVMILDENKLEHPLQNGTARNRKNVNKTGIFICIGVVFLVAVALASFILFGYYEQSSTVNSASCERRILAYYPLRSSPDLIFYRSLLQSNGISTIGNELEKQRFKNLVAKAKAKNVTTMIAVDGDWKAVSPLISDHEKRKLLVDSIVSVVLEFQLDGVDIFWKWPKTDSDFSNLLSLCKDLREKFNETGRKLLISNLVSPSVEHSDFHKQISEIVDFLNIDTNNHEGHLIVPGAPLYSGQRNQYRESIDRNLRLLSCWTKQPRKLNLVVCPDARYWNNVINSNDTTSMKAELIKGKVDGGWFYWKNIRDNGWNISEASWNHESMTPYIWNSNKRKYLTFENEESVKHKIEYGEEKNVGGITFWDLLSDDQEDTILQVVSSANLCSESNDGVVKYNCDGI